MSSLLQQLQQRKQQLSSRAVTINVKATLLFEVREAQNVPSHSIRLLALDGLESLKNLDPRFGSFEEKLMSNQEGFSRESLTPPEEKDLDKNLSQILLLLAPYFLLSSVHKVLEHLIRKYSIHVYNVDEVMQAFIPYHGTKIFVKLMSILHLKKSKKFSFLVECQTQKVAPTRTFLALAMTKNRKFLKFVCKLPTKFNDSRVSFKSLYSFFGATIIQMLVSGISERIVGEIYPFLLAGLSSTEDEFQVSTFMIVACLVSQTRIRADLIEEIEKKIIENALPHVHKNALLCLLVTRQNTDGTMKENFIGISKWNDLPECLLSFQNEGYDLSKFLNGYFDLLVAHSLKDVQTLNHLSSLLAQLPNLESYVQRIASNFLSGFSANYESLQTNPKFLQSCKTLFRSIDRNFASQLDLAVNAVLDSRDFKITSAVWWNALFQETRHQLLGYGGKAMDGMELEGVDGLMPTLSRSLRPTSQPSMTTRALQMLINLNKKKDEHISQLLKNSVLTLLDVKTDPDVLLFILKKNQLLGLIDPAVLVAKLSSLLVGVGTTDGPKEFSVFETILQYLFKTFYSSHPQLVTSLLSVILKCLSCLIETNTSVPGKTQTSRWCKTNKQLASALEIASHISHPLFSGLQTIKPEKKSFDAYREEVTSSVIRVIAQALHTDFKTGRTAVERIRTKTPALSAFLDLIYASAFGLDQTKSPEIASQLLNRSAQYFVILGLPKQSHVDLTIEDPSALSRLASVPGLPAWSLPQYDSFIGSTSDSQTTFSFCLKNVNSVIEYLKNKKSEELSLKTFLLLAIEGLPAKFGLTLSSFMKETGNSALFLSQFWMCDQYGYSETIQTTSLLMFLKTILDKKAPADITTLVPLLVGVSSYYESIRLISMECIEQFQKVASQDLKKFCSAIVAFKDSFIQSGSLETHFARIMKEFGEKFQSKIVKALIFEAINLTDPFPRYIILSTVKSYHHHNKLRWLNSLMKTYKNPLSGTTLPFYELLTFELVLKELCAEMIPAFEVDEDWEFFLHFFNPKFIFSIAESDLVPRFELRGKIFSTFKILANILIAHPEFFSLLSLFQQGQVLNFLCNILSTTDAETIAQLNDQQLHQPADLVEGSDPAFASFSAPFGYASAKDHVRKVIKVLPLGAKLIKLQLKSCLPPTASRPTTPTKPLVPKSPQQPQSKKRQRNGGADIEENGHHQETPSITPAQLARLVVLLEMFQYKRQILGEEHVGLLFQLLRLFSSESNESNEYIQTLLLASLTTVTQLLNHSIKNESVEALADIVMEDEADVKEVQKLSIEQINALEPLYEVSVISEYIRSSSNPIIHNNCLSLLSQIARLFPSKVLTNMMSIFTFMGLSTKRSDDTYTFLVIQRAIENIVPALLTSEAGKGIGVRTLIQQVIQNLDRIPEHRRLLLFSIFLKTLGFKYLPLLLCCLFSHSHVTMNSYPSSVGPKSLYTEPEQLNSFVSQLLLKFPPQYVVQSMVLFLVSLEEFASSKTTSPDKQDQIKPVVFEVLTDSSVALKITEAGIAHKVEYSSLQTLSIYLSSKELLTQILAVPLAVEQKMQDHYLRLFQFFVRTVQRCSQKGTEQQIHTRDLSLNLTDKINDFLSIEKFITAIGLLLKSPDPKLQRQTLLLLNDKLASQNQTPSHKHCLMLIQIASQLTDVLSIEPAAGLEAETESEAITKQTAALSIEIIARWLAAVPVYHQNFSDLVPRLLSALNSRTTKRKNGKAAPTPHVEASLMLALATLASQLSAQILPHINPLFESFLNVLTIHWESDGKMDLDEEDDESSSGESEEDDSQDSSEDGKSNSPSKAEILLRLAAISSIRVLISNVGNFLNCFLDRLLVLILNPSLYEDKQTRPKSEELLELIASSYPLNVLIGPIQSCFKQILELARSGVQIGRYLEYSIPNLCLFIGATLKNVTTQQITGHVKVLFNAFLDIFNIRDSVGDQPQHQAAIVLVEEAAIESFLKLVIKLNEKTFKPLFLVILEWVKIDSGLTGVLVGQNLQTKQTEEELIPRNLFFYHLVFRLTDLLQAIFVPYYSYLLPHIIKTINQQINDNPRHSLDTMMWIFKALKLYFLHDNANFVTLNVFEKLLPPLMDSLEWTGKDYHHRIQHYFIPCIVQLAINLGNEELLKPLNYQLLLKTRAESSDVRLAAIRTIHAFYAKLGEMFLPLLPESMQFIYELMEDTDPEIEETVNQLRKTLEKLLGEESFADLLR